MKKWRTLTQFSTLALFIMLAIKGKMALWMLITIVGIITTPLFGRYFCGWLCPINTLTTFTEKIKTKLGYPKRELTARIDWIGYIMLIVTLILIIVSKRTGREFPLWPVLMNLGIIVTIFLQAKVWHKLLCPFGLLFKLPAKISLLQVRIPEQCKGCGKCIRCCPGGAIEKSVEGITITKANCLLCYECLEICPQVDKRYPGVIDKTTKST